MDLKISVLVHTRARTCVCVWGGRERERERFDSVSAVFEQDWGLSAA